MLLNTDLHGENLLQRKMTCNEFIENLSELNDSTDFPRDLLRNIYYAIKQEPIPWAAATEEDLGTLIPNELVSQSSGIGGQAGSNLPGLSNTATSTQQQPRYSSREFQKMLYGTSSKIQKTYPFLFLNIFSNLQLKTQFRSR